MANPLALLLFWSVFVGGGALSTGGSDAISFVRYFVKDWKRYDSVNIFSCPGQQLKPVHLFVGLNNNGILFRYLDMRRPINVTQLDQDPNCRQVYAVDLKCPQAVAIIRTMAGAKFFNTFCRSVVLVDGNEDERWFREVLEEVLREIELTVTSDVVYATRFRINGTGEEEVVGDGMDLFGDWFLYDIW